VSREQDSVRLAAEVVEAEAERPAPAAGKGESPFAGIKMLARGEDQGGVVAEDSGGRVVQHGAERGAAEGVVKLGALLLAHVRGEV
jgi:hypothetical protein